MQNSTPCTPVQLAAQEISVSSQRTICQILLDLHDARRRARKIAAVVETLDILQRDIAEEYAAIAANADDIGATDASIELAVLGAEYTDVTDRLAATTQELIDATNLITSLETEYRANGGTFGAMEATCKN